jgi:hypothetical protein
MKHSQYAVRHLPGTFPDSQMGARPASPAALGKGPGIFSNVRPSSASFGLLMQDAISVQSTPDFYICRMNLAMRTFTKVRLRTR